LKVDRTNLSAQIDTLFAITQKLARDAEQQAVVNSSQKDSISILEAKISAQEGLISVMKGKMVAQETLDAIFRRRTVGYRFTKSQSPASAGFAD
jgi:hypothetical protein